VTLRRRCILSLAFAVPVALVLSPVVGMLLPDTPFHRVLQRTFIVLFGLFALWGPRMDPRTWPEGIQGLDVVGPDRFKRFWLGMAVSIVLMALILFVSWAVGGRGPREGDPTRSWLVHTLAALASGFLVGWFEEFLFRGYFRHALGGLVSAMFYSGAHLFRPLERSAGAGTEFDWLLGLKKLPLLFETWTDPQQLTIGLLSLFLFGLSLNRLADRTGTLWLGIGVHAGFVFGVSFYRPILDPFRSSDPWIFGGPRIYDGVLGLVGMALLYLAASRAPLPAWLQRRNT